MHAAAARAAAAAAAAPVRRARAASATSSHSGIVVSEQHGQRDHRRREHDPPEQRGHRWARRYVEVGGVVARRRSAAPPPRSRGRTAASRPWRVPPPVGSTWAVTCVGQRGHLAVEAVPAGDLEGHPGDLPRLAWEAQRPVDAADLEHEDPVGAALDGPADRDRVHDAAVEVVLAVDDGRAQQAGHGGAGHDRVDDPAGGEPVLGGPLDARRRSLERRSRGRRRCGRRAPGASRSRSGRAECRWVPVRTARVTWRIGAVAVHLAVGRPRSPTARPAARSRRAPGSAATRAPLSAPTDVPSTRSGRTPASKRARSIPTSTAPSRPPPPRTNAVRRSRSAVVHGRSGLDRRTGGPAAAAELARDLRGGPALGPERQQRHRAAQQRGQREAAASSRPCARAGRPRPGRSCRASRARRRGTVRDRTHRPSCGVGALRCVRYFSGTPDQDQHDQQHADDVGHHVVAQQGASRDDAISALVAAGTLVGSPRRGPGRSRRGTSATRGTARTHRTPTTRGRRAGCAATVEMSGSGSDAGVTGSSPRRRPDGPVGRGPRAMT